MRRLCESCCGRLRSGESGRVGARCGSSSCFLGGRRWCAAARCRCRVGRCRCCSSAVRRRWSPLLFRVCMYEVLRVEPSDRDEEVEDFRRLVHVDLDQLLRLILLQESTSETLEKEKETHTETTKTQRVSEGAEPRRPTERDARVPSLFRWPG